MKKLLVLLALVASLLGSATSALANKWDWGALSTQPTVTNATTIRHRYRLDAELANRWGEWTKRRQWRFNLAADEVATLRRPWGLPVKVYGESQDVQFTFWRFDENTRKWLLLTTEVDVLTNGVITMPVFTDPATPTPVTPPVTNPFPAGSVTIVNDTSRILGVATLSSLPDAANPGGGPELGGGFTPAIQPGGHNWGAFFPPGTDDWQLQFRFSDGKAIALPFFWNGSQTVVLTVTDADIH